MKVYTKDALKSGCRTGKERGVVEIQEQMKK
jgi:hypothetical protein